jgi:nucleoside-diphosphate-sugar epimerase
MHVFVTGASGWIGSAVVPELIGAGHEITGLARSDASAAALTAAGAQVRHGTLDDLDGLRSAAAASDGVIHLAFRHDMAFSGDYQGAADTDRRAVETIGGALAGSGRPFVFAATLPPTPGRVTTERDGPGAGAGAVQPDGGPQARMATAQWALGLASRGVRPAAVRLPPTVHGEGDAWFMAALVRIARDTGVSGYPGDGSNRWPAVHRLDAAHLFRLALEQAPAGSVLHAIDDEGVPIRAVAEVIGRHLGVPVAAISPGDAAGHFGWLAGLLGADIPASSALTCELLGWRPAQPGLIDDLDKGHYFRTPPA